MDTISVFYYDVMSGSLINSLFVPPLMRQVIGGTLQLKGSPL